MFPNFYNAQKVGSLFKPDLQKITDEALRKQQSHNDNNDNYALLLIDFQIDFCHQDGSLYVSGAIEDTRRTIEFLYRNTSSIKTIVASLDSHLAFQIFYSTWWVDAQGNHPPPHTIIRYDSIKNGLYRPLREIDWSINYVQELERKSKKTLYIWPFHTMIGSLGQALDPSLFEAIHWHSISQSVQPIFVQKGMIPTTEHYSPFEPEVKVTNHPYGILDTQTLELLASHSRIYIAGEAKSHCVLEACTSMMRYFSNRPKIIERFYLLSDCTSSVVAPGIDFETIANQQFDHFTTQGMRRVLSTDSIESTK